MFDTIILLTGAVERPIFTSVLCAHNPRLTIMPVGTLADLNALAPDVLARAADRLRYRRHRAGKCARSARLRPCDGRVSFNFK
jgi:hypothetical protein